MPEKHIPVRQCLCCSNRFPKQELLRIVRSPEGGISLDTDGRTPGRGAYCCRKASCINRLRKTGRADRILGVKIPEEIWSLALEQTVTAE